MPNPRRVQSQFRQSAFQQVTIPTIYRLATNQQFPLMDGTVFAGYGGFSFALPCIWFIFIFLSIFPHPGSPGQRAVKWVCVCVTIL